MRAPRRPAALPAGGTGSFPLGGVGRSHAKGAKYRKARKEKYLYLLRSPLRLCVRLLVFPWAAQEDFAQRTRRTAKPAKKNLFIFFAFFAVPLRPLREILGLRYFKMPYIFEKSSVHSRKRG